jgi:hypothetical protein
MWRAPLLTDPPSAAVRKARIVRPALLLRPYRPERPSGRLCLLLVRGPLGRLRTAIRIRIALSRRRPLRCRTERHASVGPASARSCPSSDRRSGLAGVSRTLVPLFSLGPASPTRSASPRQLHVLACRSPSTHRASSVAACSCCALFAGTSKAASIARRERGATHLLLRAAKTAITLAEERAGADEGRAHLSRRQSHAAHTRHAKAPSLISDDGAWALCCRRSRCARRKLQQREVAERGARCGRKRSDARARHA